MKSGIRSRTSANFSGYSDAIAAIPTPARMTPAVHFFFRNIAVPTPAAPLTSATFQFSIPPSPLTEFYPMPNTAYPMLPNLPRKTWMLKAGRALLAALFFSLLLATAAAQTGTRARDLGVPFDGAPGPLNAITDVKGVEVGQTTLISGSGPLKVGVGPVRTGVTAILPRGHNFKDSVFAGWFTLNGN